MLQKSKSPAVDLVLEGGGVQRIGLVGAVLTWSDNGLVFPRAAGTSAGAIVASRVAAHQVAGGTLSELETIVRSVDYRKFQDEGLLDAFPDPRGRSPSCCCTWASPRATTCGGSGR